MCPGFYVMCDSEHFGVVHSDLTKHELVHIYSWFWRKVIVSATRSIALLVGCQLPQIRAHSNLILVFRSSGSAPSQQSVQSTSAVVILVHRQTHQLPSASSMTELSSSPGRSACPLAAHDENNLLTSRWRCSYVCFPTFRRLFCICSVLFSLFVL